MGRSLHLTHTHTHAHTHTHTHTQSTSSTVGWDPAAPAPKPPVSWPQVLGGKPAPAAPPPPPWSLAMTRLVTASSSLLACSNSSCSAVWLASSHASVSSTLVVTAARS